MENSQYHTSSSTVYPASPDPAPAAVLLYLGPEHPRYGTAPKAPARTAWTSARVYAVVLLGTIPAAASHVKVGTDRYQAMAVSKKSTTSWCGTYWGP